MGFTEEVALEPEQVGWSLARGAECEGDPPWMGGSSFCNDSLQGPQLPKKNKKPSGQESCVWGYGSKGLFG